ARDEEIARQLEVKLQANVERERQTEEQASMNYIAKLYDEFQARIDADHELAGLYMREHELIANFVPIGSEEDERMIIDMNKKAEEESNDKDLLELYNLVMQRFESTTPEDIDLILLGDLRTMFEANAEDELWQNQEKWSLKSWNFYENCRVYILILEDGTEIHMLAERRASPATTTTNTTSVTNAQLKALIDQGVADAWATRDADTCINGDDSHNSRTGKRRQAYLARKNAGHDVAYVMTWTNLKKKMTDKYCPRGKIKKLEVEMWNLKVKELDKVEKYVSGLPNMIYGSVMASKPKTMQDAIEFATELMEKRSVLLLNVKLRTRGNLITTTKLNNNLPRSKVWP
nr:hypothetical protein [Tanacetum cinerariifolium]